MGNVQGILFNTPTANMWLLDMNNATVLAG